MDFWCYKAEIVRWIDADTVSIRLDLGFRMYTVQRLRVARIDAWEIRGVEKVKGKAAKARVEELCPVGTHIAVRTGKETGKYGRWIAEVYVEVDGEEKNLSDLLVEEGHAEYVTY